MNSEHAPTPGPARMSRPALRRIGSIVTVLVVSFFSAHCDPSLLEKRAEARRLVTVLEADLSHAVEASNRAVLSDTREASKAAASEAQRDRAGVLADVDALNALLTQLGYEDEQQLLADFKAKFVAYDVLDESTLELAVEKTNLNATHLSYGSVRAASDTFAQAVLALSSAAKKEDSLRAKALAYQAISEVREVQVLEGPHIAEPQDDAMTRLEQSMDEQLADARKALKELEAMATMPEAVAPASQALEQVVELHHQVIVLSRKNTDVRALAMTLGQKRTLASNSKDALRALDEVIKRRGSGGSR